MTPDQTWRWAPGVHAAVESGNLVLLDVTADAYFCLPGAGATLLPGPVTTEVGSLPWDTLRDLAEAGLARVGAGAIASPWTTVAPIEDLAARSTPKVAAADWAGLSLAYLTLAPAYYRQPFAKVVQRAQARRTRLGRSRAATGEAVVARAAVFNAMLPWSPVQGACLLQAALLLEFLAQAGLGADWVFGVRTWPFSAHCWVQAREIVLNDTVERVAPYRTIMKV